MAACSPTSLLAEAKCFSCLSKKELQAVIAQLLCNISAAGSGGGGQIKIYTSDPNTELVVPDDTAEPAMAYSADGTGAIYGWNAGSQTWL